jgi:hypothetical protein
MKQRIEMTGELLISLVMMWLDEATDPFHTAPGAFHTKLEFHVNGCEMEMVFTGSAPILAMVFFRERIAYAGKSCDSRVEVLHVTLTPPIHDRQLNQRKIPTRGTWTVPHSGTDG